MPRIVAVPGCRVTCDPVAGRPTDGSVASSVTSDPAGLRNSAALVIVAVPLWAVASLPVAMGGMVESFGTPPTTVATGIVVYSMIVSGFCREVFKELPMEFALEAQQLLGITLEGSVG